MEWVDGVALRRTDCGACRAGRLVSPQCGGGVMSCRAGQGRLQAGGLFTSNVVMGWCCARRGPSWWLGDSSMWGWGGDMLGRVQAGGVMKTQCGDGVLLCRAGSAAGQAGRITLHGIAGGSTPDRASGHLHEWHVPAAPGPCACQLPLTLSHCCLSPPALEVTLRPQPLFPPPPPPPPTLLWPHCHFLQWR